MYTNFIHLVFVYILRPSLTLSEFVPETYKLDLKSEREVFYGTFKGLNNNNNVHEQ